MSFAFKVITLGVSSHRSKLQLRSTWVLPGKGGFTTPNFSQGWRECPSKWLGGSSFASPSSKKIRRGLPTSEVRGYQCVVLCLPEQDSFCSSHPSGWSEDGGGGGMAGMEGWEGWVEGGRVKTLLRAGKTSPSCPHHTHGWECLWGLPPPPPQSPGGGSDSKFPQELANQLPDPHHKGSTHSSPGFSLSTDPSPYLPQKQGPPPPPPPPRAGVRQAAPFQEQKGCRQIASKAAAPSGKVTPDRPSGKAGKPAARACACIWFDPSFNPRGKAGKRGGARPGLRHRTRRAVLSAGSPFPPRPPNPRVRDRRPGGSPSLRSARAAPRAPWRRSPRPASCCR